MSGFTLDRVHLELTNRCNFRCEFCPQDSMTRPRGDMDFGLFERLAREVAQSRLAPALAYHLMGEPLLYPQLTDAVALTRELGLRAILITNGSRLGPQAARTLAPAAPHFVGLSLQTPDLRSFQLRGAAGTSYAEFRETLLAGLRELVTGSPTTKVSVFLLTTPLRWALFPATRGLAILDTREALTQALEEWSAALCRLLGDVHPVYGAPRIRDQVRRARTWKPNRIDLSATVSIETRIAGDWGAKARRTGGAAYPARIGTCHGLREHLSVLWDGTYAYCCTDFDGRTSTRNAAEVGIARFLSLPEVRADRAAFDRLRVRNSACRECLGGPSRLHRVVRSTGSVLYFGLYRKYLQPVMRYSEP